MNSLTQQGERKSTRRRWAKMGVAASVAALAPTAMSTMPAEGTVVDIAPGHNITVFHNIDFIATFGHTLGDSLTVTVRRNGVEIGTATGPTVDTPEGAGLETNHGPEGAAAPGDCWEGHTPDIRPGDRVTVSGTDFTDTVIVDNIDFTGRPRELANKDIVVPFDAFRANGRAIPATFIDSGEFRAASNNSVRFEGNRVHVERRPGATAGHYWLRYNSPFNPSRNDSENPFDQRQLRRALLGDGHAVGFGHVAPLPAESMLYDGLDDTPGPAIGCNGSPSARWQVNNVSPDRIGPNNRSQLFKATGRTFDAAQVMVRLVDRDQGEPVRTVEKRATITGNTWNVSFRPGQLSALDGKFRVSSLHRLAGETNFIGGPGKFATRNLP
jgi:hypothetical protein